MKKHRVLIAGYYTAAILGIQQLFAAGYQPQDIGLLTYDDIRNLTLVTFARANGIEVKTFSVKSPECLAWIQERGFDTLLSLYYRHIIPASVLELFPGRAVNLHAGLLPEYAGCWSSAWSIINGEANTGYTWHYMTPDIDAGNIIRQGLVEIQPTDTAYSLYYRVMEQGIAALSFVRGVLNSRWEGDPQQGERHYYPRALPFDGYIPREMSRENAERFIRALYFPPFKGAILRLPDGTDREILTMQQYEEAIERG